MLKPLYCFQSNCPLARRGYSFSSPDGKGTSGVVIVGEALGSDEAVDGKPFRPQAQAGSKLEECFRLQGYTRDMFYLWNILGCQPPGNLLDGMPYEYKAVEKCKEHFNRIVGGFHPPLGKKKVILALGNVPLKHLLKVSGVAKEKQSISHLRGYVYESSYGLVVPSLHPSFIKRGMPNLTPLLGEDIRKAVETANGKFTDYPSYSGYLPPRYIEYPSLDEVEGWYWKAKDNPNLPISCDIETPDSRDIEEDEREGLEGVDIVQVQFSIEKKTGIAIPWNQEYLPWIEKIFRLRNNKLGFNWWNFDGPRVESKGVEVRGKVIDLMWMWKHYHPRLPRGLQSVSATMGFPFPWKHLFGKNLQWYGCFSGETRVMMANGNAIPFSKLWNQMVPTLSYGKVSIPESNIYAQGMDIYGNRIPVRIVGIKKMLGPKHWVKIDTDATDQSIVATGDHKIWANSEWVAAKDIKVGDRIRSNRLGSPSILAGVVMGDGSVDKRGRLGITHNGKQKEYLAAKALALGGKVREFIHPLTGTRYYRTEVWVSPKLWRDRYYTEDGVKIFHAPNNKSLAIMYMDNGTLTEHGNPGIYCFYSNMEECTKWFESMFGVNNVKLYVDKRVSRLGGRIALSGCAKAKFFDMVKDFIHPSMYYKLPTPYKGMYKGWLEKLVPQTTIVTGVDTNYTQKRQSSQFCITVDHPTHRFFVMGGLVSNCADVDAPLWIWEKLPELMKQRGVWDGYMESVYSLHPIMERAKKVGIPVNEEKRVELRKELVGRKKELNKEIQRLIPDEIRQYEPRRKWKDEKGQEHISIGFTMGERWNGEPPPRDRKGRKKEPKIVKEAKEAYIIARDILRQSGRNVTPFYKFARRKYGLCKKRFTETNKKTGEREEVERWCRVKEWKPSKEGMVRYLDHKREELLKNPNGKVKME